MLRLTNYDALRASLIRRQYLFMRAIDDAIIGLEPSFHGNDAQNEVLNRIRYFQAKVDLFTEDQRRKLQIPFPFKLGDTYHGPFSYEVVSNNFPSVPEQISAPETLSIWCYFKYKKAKRAFFEETRNDEEFTTALDAAASGETNRFHGTWEQETTLDNIKMLAAKWALLSCHYKSENPSEDDAEAKFDGKGIKVKKSPSQRFVRNTTFEENELEVEFDDTKSKETACSTNQSSKP